MGLNLFKDVATFHMAYIVISILTMLLLYQHTKKHSMSYHRYDDSTASILEMFNTPATAGILNCFTLAIIIFTVYLGFRVPLEIENIFAGGAFSLSLEMPVIQTTSWTRGAQVIGIMCYSTVLIKLIKLIFPVIFLIIMCAGAAIAVKYII
jgi:hypothetical protein